MKMVMFLKLLNPFFWIRNAKTIFGGVPNAFVKGALQAKQDKPIYILVRGNKISIICKYHP